MGRIILSFFDWFRAFYFLSPLQDAGFRTLFVTALPCSELSTHLNPSGLIYFYGSLSLTMPTDEINNIHNLSFMHEHDETTAWVTWWVGCSNNESQVYTMASIIFTTFSSNDLTELCFLLMFAQTIPVSEGLENSLPSKPFTCWKSCVKFLKAFLDDRKNALSSAG